jgi:hypothetical protein
MSDNRDLEQKILKALRRHQTKTSHKSRLIFSIIAGLIVTIIFSQIKSNPPPNSSPSTQKTYYPFSFPMTYCGNISAGGTNNWYPVYVNYSESNLIQIQKFYCCDAEYDPSTNKIIVASFYNRAKADQLVAILKSQKFSSAYLGSGERIATSRTSNSKKCR